MDALPEPIPRYHVEPMQYAGLLFVHWHPHIHAIVSEGVFDEDGSFVPVPNILVDRAIEIWRGKALH